MEDMTTNERISYHTCICHSQNWKCFEFENECVILQCMDCGRFDEVNLNRDYGIQHWSGGSFKTASGFQIYFCSYGGDSPRYEYDDTLKEVVRVLDRPKFFGIVRGNSPVKRTIYYYDNTFVTKNYEAQIKRIGKQLDTIKQKYKKYKADHEQRKR